MTKNMPPVDDLAFRRPQRCLPNEAIFGYSEDLPVGVTNLFFMCTLCAIFPKMGVIQLEKWYTHVK